MAYVFALDGARMEKRRSGCFKINGLLEKRGIAWCSGMFFCFCMGAARADSGWDVWCGAYINQSFGIEANATVPGMAGAVDAKAEHSIFKQKGYAGARVDLGRWVGPRLNGWVIERRSSSVGSGLSPSMGGASAKWGGMGLSELASTAGQSSTSEPIMAGWSLESQSVMAIRKFEIGGRLAN